MYNALIHTAIKCFTLCGMGQKTNLIDHVTVFKYRQSFTNIIIKETH